MRPSFRPPLVPDTLVSLIPAGDPGAEHSPMLRLALLVQREGEREREAWQSTCMAVQIWARPDR